MRHCTSLTTRQYTFLDKLHMRQYAFLQCNYTLLSSSNVIVCTSTCGFRSESMNELCNMDYGVYVLLCVIEC